MGKEYWFIATDDKGEIANLIRARDLEHASYLAAHSFPWPDGAAVSIRRVKEKETAVVNTGGLLRCCIETIDNSRMRNVLPLSEGDRLRCDYHAEHYMVLKDGVWQWDRNLGK